MPRKKKNDHRVRVLFILNILVLAFALGLFAKPVIQYLTRAEYRQGEVQKQKCYFCDLDTTPGVPTPTPATCTYDSLVELYDVATGKMVSYTTPTTGPFMHNKWWHHDASGAIIEVGTRMFQNGESRFQTGNLHIVHYDNGNVHDVAGGVVDATLENTDTNYEFDHWECDNIAGTACNALRGSGPADSIIHFKFECNAVMKYRFYVKNKSASASTCTYDSTATLYETGSTTPMNYTTQSADPFFSTYWWHTDVNGAAINDWSKGFVNGTTRFQTNNLHVQTYENKAGQYDLAGGKARIRFDMNAAGYTFNHWECDNTVDTTCLSGVRSTNAADQTLEIAFKCNAVNAYRYYVTKTDPTIFSQIFSFVKSIKIWATGRP